MVLSERNAAGARAEPPPTPTVEQERVGDFVHTSLMQNITLADRKAGILFTLVSAALLFLFTRLPNDFASATGALWLLVVVLLVTGAACAFLVVFPRFRRSADSANGTSSVLFWGEVARQPDTQAYIAEVCRRDPAELARGKLGYCYDLACICARKFRLLRIAMGCSAAGLLLFLVALAVGLPAGGGGPPMS